MRTNTITNRNHVPDSVIERIKEISPEILAMHNVILAAPKSISGRTAYICPVCENGTGKDRTGIVPQDKGNAWLYHCFKCDKTFDNIHLLAIHYGLDETTDFSEICHRACEEFGIWFEQDYSSSSQKPVTESNSRIEFKMIQEDIAGARHNLTLLPFDARRGLTLDTLEHFNCGFIADWVHPICRVKGIRGVPTPRLIIPSGNHYLARLIVNENEYDESKRKYVIPKQHAGKKFFFNFDSLSNDSDIPNIIVEGEIDAMSIWQATRGTIPVVAIAGVTGQKKLINQIVKRFNEPKNKPCFMILFDPDKTGRDAAEKLKDELNTVGFTTTIRFFSDEVSKTDANDILREEGNKKLAELIYSMINDSKKEIKEKITQFNKEQEIVKKIKKWTNVHGEIAPETLADLKESADYLRSLTTEKITYSIAIQSRTCYALAKCQYYDFYSEASDKFFECMKEAKKRATQVLKNLKPNDPIPQGISGLDFITKKDITDKVKVHLSEVVKNHKSYIEKLQKETERQQKIERINEQNRQKQNNISRIKELYQQPESSERNEEIVKLIQKSCT